MSQLTRLLLSGLAPLLLGSGSTALADGDEPGPVYGHGGGDRVGTGMAHAGRSAVIAPHGAAATAHPLATQTAIDVLRAGGSAVDAAIAANAMLGLVEPVGNGIGGDLFAIVWDPETEQLYGLNASGRSPMGATLEDMQAAADKHGDGSEIPPWGSAPVSVPGTVDGWFMLHGKFGKTPMPELLDPAITYAEAGAPIPEVIAYYWGRSDIRYTEAFESGMLEEVENARETYFSPIPTEGALFQNPDLANTYRLIAEGGRDAYYKGEIARTIDAYMKRIGGFLRYEDLAAHEGEWVDPLCVPYRETDVCQLPPNTQGVATLQMLQMLEGFPMREFGFGSTDSLMAQVEAKRLAFEDRARGYVDPDFFHIPPSAFIDPDHGRERASLIDLTVALSNERIRETSTEFVDVVEETLLADAVAKLGDGSEGEPDWTSAFENAGLLDANPEDPDSVWRKPADRPSAPTPEDLKEAEKKLETGDTTYLTVTDKNGMMVSLIQSNYRGMGSGLVPDGLGFMLQDRGQLFSLDPDHPNVFEPGKRPFNTIIPGFAFKYDGPDCEGDNARGRIDPATCERKPWLSFGLMGGGMQPQGQTQIILNLIDHDMGLQEAGDAARWRHDGSCQPTDALTGADCETSKGTIYLESGFPEHVRSELEARGHTVKDGRGGFGGYQAIMRDFENGTWVAATEMRKDGSAGGY